MNRCATYGVHRVAGFMKETKYFPLAPLDCNALCSELCTIRIDYFDLNDRTAIE